MAHRVKVSPLGDGWRLSVDGVANEMVFRSGREAEAAARRLAIRLARAGRPTEVRIHLRDNRLGGRFVCPAGGGGGAFEPPRFPVTVALPKTCRDDAMGPPLVRHRTEPSIA